MIWLVGNRGMLGSEVEALLRANGVPFMATDREVDITREGAADEHLARAGSPAIEWIVNCSAYTAVEKAEEEKDLAFAVNERGVRLLARTARTARAALLHISTDYVFDGTKEGAYTEDDPPCALGVYGQSKLAGEKALADELTRHVIIRTAWLFGRRGPNFVATMLRLFAERESVRVVADQWGSPTYAPDLARAILAVVRHRGEAPAGIYHFTNEGRTTWYDFARAIYQQAAARGAARPGVTVVPIAAADYPSKARRPANSYMAKEKIRRTFGINIRGWEEALAAYFDEGGT
jgi:dTDP-4-dehydrorhamnose reductase